MLRHVAPWTLACLLLLSCGPDRRPCSGTHPNFVVVLKLAARSLPADTTVHVTYGGSGTEDYDLAGTNPRHEVLFCSAKNAAGVTVDASLAPADASSGDGDPALVAELSCELWTGGFTTLEVRGTGFATMIYKLTPEASKCTVSREIVIDSPDAG